MSSAAERRALIDAVEHLPDGTAAAPSRALRIFLNCRGAGHARRGLRASKR